MQMKRKQRPNGGVPELREYAKKFVSWTGSRRRKWKCRRRSKARYCYCYLRSFRTATATVPLPRVSFPPLPCFTLHRSRRIPNQKLTAKSANLDWTCFPGEEYPHPQQQLCLSPLLHFGSSPFTSKYPSSLAARYCSIPYHAISLFHYILVEIHTCCRQ